MAYLAMPNHLRERHAALREWVNGDRAYAPMKLWQFFYPTAFKTVGVHVWSRCVGNDLPEAVAIFHCAHALLVIAPSASADTAVVLPPLLKPSPDADNLDGWVTTFESDDRVTEQWAYTIRGTDDVVLSDVGESLPVAVRIACGDTQLVFEADLRTATPANPDRLVTYEISGGGMPGTLTLTTTDGGRRWSCKVASAATPLALQLAHLLSQGAAFTVDDRKGRQIFPKATGWIAPPI